MLEDIDEGDINDADLRMYVESHTYFDCKDLVRVAVCLSFNVWSLQKQG